MRLIRLSIRGEIDVPLACEKMNFRRPDIMRVRPRCWGRPHDLLLRRLQIRHIARLPKREICRRGVHVVVPAVLVFHPWIGPEGSRGFVKVD